jgi:hypothetical protein
MKQADFLLAREFGYSADSVKVELIGNVHGDAMQKILLPSLGYQREMVEGIPGADPDKRTIQCCTDFLANIETINDK